MNTETDRQKEHMNTEADKGQQKKAERQKKQQEIERKRSSMTEYSWFKKALIFMLADILVIAFSYFAALMIRFDFVFSSIETKYVLGYVWSMPYWIIATIVVFYCCRLYHSIWSYVSLAELYQIIKAYLILIIVYIAGGIFMRLHMPRSYYVIGIMISFCLTVASRFAYRFIRSYQHRGESARSEAAAEHVMIIGAGAAGQTLIRELRNSEKTHVKVCCAIDDNEAKKGRTIIGVPIVGNREEIFSAVKNMISTVSSMQSQAVPYRRKKRSCISVKRPDASCRQFRASIRWSMKKSASASFAM